MLPPLFSKIKIAILGRNYDLSFSFVSAARIKLLNKTYRGLDCPTDILSFPLAKKAGEILICQSEARKKAKEFDRSEKNFLNFLFIHGAVHLLGHDHGHQMEKMEEKWRRYFKI